MDWILFTTTVFSSFPVAGVAGVPVGVVLILVFMYDRFKFNALNPPDTSMVNMKKEVSLPERTRIVYAATVSFFCVSADLGQEKIKEAPFPLSDSSQILPPCSSIIFLTMANPTPVLSTASLRLSV